MQVQPWALGSRALRPIHPHPHVCTHLATAAHALAHPSGAHQPRPHTSVSHAQSRQEPHMESGLLRGAGQVSRCRERRPGPTGSLIPRMIPHSAALLQAQPARTRRPPARCPGLLGRRQIPRRRLAHPDSAAATTPADRPLPRAQGRPAVLPQPAWRPRQRPPVPLPPRVERRLLSEITTRGSPKPFHLTLGQSCLPQDLCFPVWKIGREVGLEIC